MCIDTYAHAYKQICTLYSKHQLSFKNPRASYEFDICFKLQLLFHICYRLQHWKMYLFALKSKLMNQQLLLPFAEVDKPQGLGYRSENQGSTRFPVQNC